MKAAIAGMVSKQKRATPKGYALIQNSRMGIQATKFIYEKIKIKIFKPSGY
ncbi:MAG: hypothetical protein V7L29_06520 [Nostoc sp.]|uniref:hypothetical protein n=1 Tax=Nostoc sp. TaxID=1180 RepID=UPI002FF04B2B